MGGETDVWTWDISTKMLKTKNKVGSHELEVTDLDEALSLMTYGRFHYIIMASSALCLLSSGLHNGLSAYVLPAARCELNLQNADIGYINAAFLVGGTCSSFLWGVIADLTGRKKVLIYTLLLDVLVTLCCCLMQGFIGLVICRFINGFLIGAPGSITFTYLAEFHAPRHRSKSVYFSGIFYTLAWLILPTLAIAILPLQVELRLQNIVLLSSWRIYVLIIAVPEIIAGVWMIYLPESPKFLAISNPKMALGVVKKMYRFNTGKPESDFPVKTLKTKIVVKTEAKCKVNCSGKALRVIQDMYTQSSKLLQSSLVFPTFLICGIMFANMFGYFGMGLWLPQLLKRYQSYENLNTSTVNQNFTRIHQASCTSDFDTWLYLSTMTMALSSLIGNIASGVLAGKFEIKIIPLVTMLFGGLSAVSFYWLNSSYQTVAAASIFQTTMATANIAVGSLTVELFPTAVSAVAISASMFAGRIGAIVCNIIFGYLIEMHSEIAVFLVSGVLLLGAALCLVIPKQKQEKTKIIEIKPEMYQKIEISIISAPM